MPQLYSAIEDPHINTRIKRQALEVKRKSNISLEAAVSEKKKKQQEQVDNLIKDIVVLVEDQELKDSSFEDSEVREEVASLNASRKISHDEFVLKRGNTEKINIK